MKKCARTRGRKEQQQQQQQQHDYDLLKVLNKQTTVFLIRSHTLQGFEPPFRNITKLRSPFGMKMSCEKNDES